jgi:hypothetical protein
MKRFTESSFEDLLIGHNWKYDFSVDPDVREAGQKKDDLIQATLQRQPELYVVYQQLKPRDY